MARLTLKKPQHVGDLAGGISVDKLDLVAVSINLQRNLVTGSGQTTSKNAIVSVMFGHPGSGWTHTVTLTGPAGEAKWEAIKALYPDFEKQIMTVMADQLPAGDLS